MTFFGCNVLNANPLKCISMNNQKRMVRLQIVNVSSDEPAFFPIRIKTSKCSGNFNDTDDPYAKSVFLML